MAEVTAAAAAQDFGADHPVGGIGAGNDRALQRLVEARPARAAIELGRRGEQSLVAPGTGKNALAMLLVERAGEGAFGAGLPQDVIALWAQLLEPGRIALCDSEFHRWRRAWPAQGEQADRSESEGADESAARSSVLVHQPKLRSG